MEQEDGGGGGESGESGAVVEPRVGQRCQGKQVAKEAHHHDDDDVGKEPRPVLLDAVQKAVFLAARVGAGARQGQGLALCGTGGEGG